MKKILTILSLATISLTANASSITGMASAKAEKRMADFSSKLSVSYDCINSEASDVALPTKLYVEIEGSAVSVQNVSNDMYYEGKLVATITKGDKVATGFDELILDGSIIISEGISKSAKTASITIVDMALDSTETTYTCKLTE